MFVCLSFMGWAVCRRVRLSLQDPLSQEGTDLTDRTLSRIVGEPFRVASVSRHSQSCNLEARLQLDPSSSRERCGTLPTKKT